MLKNILINFYNFCIKMDQFCLIKTGNRKNFLDKARKKKQTMTTTSAQRQDIQKIQKNIRRFLSLARLMKGENINSPINLLNPSYTEVNPEKIYSLLLEDSSYFIYQKWIIVGIQYCLNNSQRNSQNSMSEQNSNLMPQIGELLCNKISKTTAIFHLLNSKQKNFWLIQILLKSSGRFFPDFGERDRKYISKMFKIPTNLVTVFSRSNNYEHMRELIRSICGEPNHQITSFDRLENIFHEEIYMSFMECFWDHSLIQLKYKNPQILIELLNYLLATLSQNCHAQILKENKISKYLFESQYEATQEIIRQKQQWLSFLDFLNIPSSKFVKSVMKGFIYSSSFEEFGYSMDLIITIFEIYGNEVVKILDISCEELEIILEKTSTWIKMALIERSEDQQKILFLMVSILERKFFEMGDKEFCEFFRQKPGYLEKIIKNHLVKIIYQVIFLKKPTKRIDKVFKTSIRLLQDLYNKIFRTNILSTQIFVNETMSNKLKYYKIDSLKDETSQFISKFPFIFPLMLRLQKFREFVVLSHYHPTEGIEEAYHSAGTITVRRGRQFQDAFEGFKNRSLKKPFRIQFITEFGRKEDGIDAGGLTKQFINRVLKAIFKKEFGMWIENEGKELLPHPIRAEAEKEQSALQYHFIGRILGKALSEGITIGPKFSGPFLNALIGKKNSFEDLKKIDRDLYNSLLYIRTMEEDAKSLCLTFQFKDEMTGKYINLKYNGHRIPVTNENKEEYVSLLANYKVNRLLEFQSRYIRSGLSQMIRKQWLYMFNYEELSYLISGNGEINVDELRKYSRYAGYSEYDETVLYFWKVVKEMDQKNRSNLLFFVTSCPRPSFLGFKDLTPHFTIVKTNKLDSLPVAHTCSNVIELPDYRNEQILRKKLLQAINSDSGYEIA